MKNFLTPKLENKAYRLIDHKFDFLSDEELISLPKKSWLVADIESYLDLFFVGIKDFRTNKYLTFEESPDKKINIDKLKWCLNQFTFVGFNWHGYDKIMLALFLTGKWSTYDLSMMGSEIIENNVKAWELEDYFGVKIPKTWDSVDIMPVAPLDASLKIYAGRMHTKHMQDLPFEPKTKLGSAENFEVVGKYCLLDCDKTMDLANFLQDEIKLRITMSEQYNIDLRSKTDAQIAESVIKHEYFKLTGQKAEKLKKIPKYIQYELPNNVCFQTAQLNDILQKILESKFSLDKAGSPMWPDNLGELERTKSGWKRILKVKIGENFYKLGMGGLHSQEESISYLASELMELADNDVESFYPKIILNLGLYPKHLGVVFLQIFEEIVSSRLNAKREAKNKNLTSEERSKYKSDASCLKIVINGLFGKLGNKYSVVYSPQLMLQVTISGQLYLLMLIEAFELNKLKVVSGNTDGFIAYYEKNRRSEVRKLISQWEQYTNFKTEETKYSATYSANVNNYIACTDDFNEKATYKDMQLGCKTKGWFSERGSALNSILSKNPESLICTDAVLEYLVNKTPIEETIKNCKDVRRFLTVRAVRGGAHKGGVFLGKAVRYYFSNDSLGCIYYLSSGNKVPKSEGAEPLMDLPLILPTNIDYQKYIETAEEMLILIGALKAPQQTFLF